MSTTAPTASIRLGAWYNDREVELRFPDGWEVTPCPPADGPDVGEAGVAGAFAAPYGTQRLREIARGRTRACIVIDDLSRPTPGARLLPHLLGELNAAGVPDDAVEIVMGIANHRTTTHEDRVKKLGSEAVARVRVSDHDPRGECVRVGETRFGTAVEVNARVAAADLKILVGSIIPHAAVGFSGGSKLLLPAACSEATALAFHRGSCLRGGYGTPEVDARLEADDAARLAGVDFIVNCVPNSTLGLAGVFCGDVVTAHRAGCERAAQVVASPTPTEQDVCLLSAYPKDGEFLQHSTAFAPMKSAPEPIARVGGTVIVALDSVEGLGEHLLFGPGGPLHSKRPPRVRDRELAFFAPELSASDLPAETRNATRLFREWDDVVRWLVSRHGNAATAAVFPCATMQLSNQLSYLRSLHAGV